MAGAGDIQRMISEAIADAGKEWKAELDKRFEKESEVHASGVATAMDVHTTKVVVIEDSIKDIEGKLGDCKDVKEKLEEIKSIKDDLENKYDDMKTNTKDEVKGFQDQIISTLELFMPKHC